MASGLDYPTSYDKGAEFGSLSQIAEYLPQIAMVLKGLGVDTGSMLQQALMPNSFKGAGMGISPQQVAFDAHAANALNHNANAQQARTDLGMSLGVDRHKGHLNTLINQFELSRHNSELFAQHHTSALSRAGVGYYGATPQGGVPQGVTNAQGNINALFGALSRTGEWASGGGSPEVTPPGKSPFAAATGADAGTSVLKDDLGTTLSDRGAVGAMYHRAHQREFEGDRAGFDSDKVAGRVTTLTKALSDLARTMGTDVENAARRLNATLGMDVTAAFRGNEARLGTMIHMRTETTRATGISQGALAEMTGMAANVGARYGGPQGQMVGHAAGTVAGYQSTPGFGYGIDPSAFANRQAERTAAAASSQYAIAFSGLYETALASGAVENEAEFMEMVGDTTDIDELTKRFGSNASFDELWRRGHTVEAEQFRMQNLNAVNHALNAANEDMEHDAHMVMQEVMGAAYDKDKVDALIEAGMGDKANWEKHLELSGTDLSSKFGEAAANLNIMWEDVGGMFPGSEMVAGKEERKRKFEEAQRRADILKEAGVTEGGVTGLAAYLRRNEGEDKKLGDVMGAFFGVASIESVLSAAVGGTKNPKEFSKQITKLLDDKDTGRAAGRYLQDIASSWNDKDMTNKDKEAALKAIADGDVDTLRGLTKSGRIDTKRREILGLGDEELSDEEGKLLKNDVAVKKAILKDIIGEDAELGEYDPYTRTFEGLDLSAEEQKEYEEQMKAAGVKSGPMEGFEVVINMVGDLLTLLGEGVTVKPAPTPEPVLEGQ